MLTATNKYLIFSHFFKQPHTRSDDGVCDLKIVHDVKNAHNFFWLCKWSRLFIWKEINRWVVEEWVFVEIQIKFLNIQLNNFKWSKWPSAISHHSMIVYAKPFHTIFQNQIHAYQITLATLPFIINTRIRNVFRRSCHYLPSMRLKCLHP